MVTQNMLKDFTKILLKANKEELLSFAASASKGFFEVSKEVNEQENKELISPLESFIVLLKIIRVAIMADNEIQPEELAFADLLYGGFEEVFPGIVTMERINETLASGEPVTREELVSIGLITQYNVKACADVIIVMLSFLAVDGRITVGERLLIEEYLPIIADCYDDSTLAQALVEEIGFTE